MKKSDLKRYAQLIVRKGANVQKGQDVVISASVNDAYFVEFLIEEAYKAKARTVTVDWTYTKATKLHYKYQKVQSLSEFPTWLEERWRYRVETCPAMIHLSSEDPDGLKGVDHAKIGQVRKNIGPIIRKYRNQMDNKYQWTIAAIPGEAWAKKIFPHLATKAAVNALWEAIFTCARVNGDALVNWDQHNANLLEKCQKLNALKIKTLTYKSANGTDFQVGLLPVTSFKGGGSTTLDGVYFNPNMPTEECFVSPNKTTAQGTVMSTKPLSVMGQLVDHFGFVFQDGKIVEVLAENPDHKKVLEELISTDEGARQLGEVALVPFSSPVNRTDLLFYNTLFDENACCHLAIGNGFTDTIEGFETMTEEELKAVGLNESVIHVDFMIGSADLSIVAETYEGKTVTIFHQGDWAI